MSPDDAPREDGFRLFDPEEAERLRQEGLRSRRIYPTFKAPAEVIQLVEDLARHKLAELEAKARERAEALREERARLAEGWRALEEAKVLQPGYLVMAALDGHLSAVDAAELEEQLSAADPLLRAEYDLLLSARRAAGSLEFAACPAGSLDGFEDEVLARLEEEPPSGKKRASLSELEALGFREVGRVPTCEETGAIREVVQLTVAQMRALLQRAEPPGPTASEGPEAPGEAASGGASRKARSAMDRLRRLRACAPDPLGEVLDHDALTRPGPPLGAEVAFQTLRANPVGGDLLDVIPTESGCFLALGDASGRGAEVVGMALTARATLRVLCVEGASPAEVLRRMNALLHRPASARFMSLVLLSWDRATGRVTWASAGGENLLVWRVRTGRVEEIKSGGVVLGVVRDADRFFRDHELSLGPGDLLVSCSDGLLEAQSPEGTFLSQRARDRAIAASAAAGGRSVVQALHDLAEEHRQGGPPTDDVSVFALRR